MTDFKVTAKAYEFGDIHLSAESNTFPTLAMEQVIKTTDAAVHGALIRLGWLPPEDAERLRAENEALVEALEWIRDNARSATKELIVAYAVTALARAEARKE